MRLQVKGSTRFAAPTCTAHAPAIIISMTSRAEDTPPMPTTGTDTARATSETILSATGNTAGPLNPPVRTEMTGLRVRRSMRIPTNVLMRDTASAPPSITAFAMSVMDVTLGLSLTISGFVALFLTS